jgi:hypothetical protein
VSDDGNGTAPGDGTGEDGAAGDGTVGDDARGSGDPAAGWYPDPDVHGGQRYWDGQRWTDARRSPGPPAPATWGTPAGGPSSSPWGSDAGGAATPSWSTPGAASPPVDTWLWQSIVATIFCCQPFGIVAIVYSAMAGTARDLGNLDLARHRAGQARTWTLVSVGTVVVLVLGFVLVAGLGALFFA